MELLGGLEARLIASSDAFDSASEGGRLARRSAGRGIEMGTGPDQ